MQKISLRYYLHEPSRKCGKSEGNYQGNLSNGKQVDRHHKKKAGRTCQKCFIPRLLKKYSGDNWEYFYQKTDK